MSRGRGRVSGGYRISPGSDHWVSGRPAGREMRRMGWKRPRQPLRVGGGAWCKDPKEPGGTGWVGGLRAGRASRSSRGSTGGTTFKDSDLPVYRKSRAERLAWGRLRRGAGAQGRERRLGAVSHCCPPRLAGPPSELPPFPLALGSLAPAWHPGGALGALQEAAGALGKEA